MGCRESIFFDKSTIDFPIFLLFFNTKFFFSYFLNREFLIFMSNHAAGHPDAVTYACSKKKIFCDNQTGVKNFPVI